MLSWRTAERSLSGPATGTWGLGLVELTKPMRAAIDREIRDLAQWLELEIVCVK
jgi:hypothetical protein